MRRIEREDVPTIKITFEGNSIVARQGDSVATALIAASHMTFRTTPVSSTARGPLCMMGACFDCLIEIDGVGNQQACMIEVREGMAIKRQQGAIDITPQGFSSKNVDTAS